MSEYTLLRFRWKNAERQTKKQTFHFTLGRQTLTSCWINLYFWLSLNLFSSESTKRAYTHWFLLFRPSRINLAPKNIEIKTGCSQMLYDCKNSTIFQRFRIFQLWPDPAGSGSLGSGSFPRKIIGLHMWLKFKENMSFPGSTVCPCQNRLFLWLINLRYEK